MTIDDKVVTWIIAGTGVVLALVAWMRTRRQDACNDGSLHTDMAYIKRGVDDIRVSQQRLQDDMGRLADRVTKVETRLEAHLNMHPPD